MRFNLALGRVDFSGGEYRKFFGEFSQRARQPLPSASSVLYTLQEPYSGEINTLDVPFAVLKPSRPFYDQTSYYNTYCEKDELVEGNSTRLSQGNRVTEIIQEIPLEPGLIVLGNKNLRRPPVLPEQPIPITEATSISQFFHLNNDTAIMKIGSFVWR